MLSSSTYLPRPNDGRGGVEDYSLTNGCAGDRIHTEKEKNGYLVGEHDALIKSPPCALTRTKSKPDDKVIPFSLLPGEVVEQRINCSEANVILTNYRLFACLADLFYNIPVRTIEYVEMRELTVVLVYCKFGKVVRLCLDTPEDCADLWRFITSLEASQVKSEDLFAFKYYQAAKSNNGLVSKLLSGSGDCEASMFVKDIQRMGFNTSTIWRTSEINSKYEVCKTYPKFHIVPANVSDDDIQEVAQFRTMRRFPSVVWRSKENGCVIARCSQPEVGWFGWRCEKDEQLLSAIAQSAKMDHAIGAHHSGHDAKPTSFLLVDARSFATAIANRAKGGGCECVEYYPTCDIQFMGLVNIHAIRKSFQSVRIMGQEQTNWYSTLEKTGWLHYLSALIRSSLVIVEAIHIEKRSAVVHCSDGWDRTAQLVSLAELLLDPYYRTIQGFIVLVEREWLEFGHKFADRCGHSNDKIPHEISPVFFQWLDAVYQIMRQYPSSFEFNESFLLKIVHHMYSCLFGTFLCNSIRERQQLKVKSKTASIWNFLLSGRKDFTNYLYVATDEVLYPNHHIRHMQFWEHVFIGEKHNPSVQHTHQHQHQQHCQQQQQQLSQQHSSTASDTSKLSESDSGNFTHNSAMSNGGPKYSDPKLSQENIQALPHTTGELTDIDGGSKSAFEPAEDVPGTSDCQAVEDNIENNNLVMPTNELSINHSSNISKFTSSTNDDDDDHTAIESIELTKLTSTKEVSSSNETETSEEDANSTLSDSATDKSKMTDSVKTLTGDLCRPPSMDDTCIPGRGFPEPDVDPNQLLMDHRPNAMRKVYSSPDSPRTARLIRTKSVPDIVTASLGIEATADIGTKHPSLEGNKVLLNKNLIRDLSRYIDCDGLTIFHNYIDYKLLNIEERHSQEMAKLQKRIQIERQARMGLQQQLQKLSARESGDYSPVTFSDASHDDLLSLPGSTSGGRSSVSSLSNEEGWEQIQYDDVQPIRWVPDHVSTNCSNCGQQFSVMIRRHHCRKCGALFCDPCSSHQISVPDEQLYEPVRVCVTCYESIVVSKTT